jgi:hypothetical protein
MACFRRGSKDKKLSSATSEHLENDTTDASHAKSTVSLASVLMQPIYLGPFLVARLYPARENSGDASCQLPIVCCDVAVI